LSGQLRLVQLQLSLSRLIRLFWSAQRSAVDQEHSVTSGLRWDATQKHCAQFRQMATCAELPTTSSDNAALMPQ